MNRPSCYGLTAKQSPHYRDHKCINCLYLLDCVEKETMMEKQTRPDCYGTQPKYDTILWDERNPDALPCVGCGEPLTIKTLARHVCSLELAKGIDPRKEVGLGTKLDQTKPRWSLLPSGTIAQVIAVLEYGAARYAVDNWKQVPESRKRYYDAAHRHLNSWWDGTPTDPESGLPHLAHAICSLLFLLWFDNQEPD